MSPSFNSENKRIAKNTSLLYFRLLFLTFINLYTVRITLEALGVVDFGIYNVVGSVVATLSILTGTMTSASQRFLSFHLGRNDYDSYSKAFSVLLISFGIISIFLIIIGEALGYIFIHKLLNIPVTKLTSAQWIYQTSLVTFVANLIMIAYSSSIIANERMGIFALFSIIDGILKLILVAILIRFNGNRLILYGILTMIEGICILIMHISYCKYKFKFCRFTLNWNSGIFKEITAYAGWNLFGSTTAMLMTQGQNILLNIFFGPVINAAKAIGDRINNVINGFSTNLYMAVSPQIIKSYAAGDFSRTMSLILKSSRISFMLLFILSFPLICNMEAILHLWLGRDSSSTDMAVFSKLMLIYCMCMSMEQPITRLIQASGKIKRYQIYVGIVMICFIPIAALVLALGVPAFATMIVLIIITLIAQYVRILIAHQQESLDISKYLKEVILPIAAVSVTGVVLYNIKYILLTEGTFLQNALSFAICLITGLICCFTFGLTKNDRQYILSFIKRK